MRMTMAAFLLLCLGSWDDSSEIQKKRVQGVPTKRTARPSVEKALTRLSACPPLDCRLDVSTTRWAVIPISDTAFLPPFPNPICACVGDSIEWTYLNGSHTTDKEVYITDTDAFLHNGDCKKAKKVKKDKQEKAGCHIESVTAGTYKYAVKGSHFLDPEVEVQGGIYPSASPPPQPR